MWAVTGSKHGKPKAVPGFQCFSAWHGERMLVETSFFISVHVSHLYWTACQCKGCSKKKMNCMYSTISSHLILVYMAVTQHLISSAIDLDADHFPPPPPQKQTNNTTTTKKKKKHTTTTVIAACWLQPASSHWDWTRSFSYALHKWKNSSVLISLLTSQHFPEHTQRGTVLPSCALLPGCHWQCWQ